MNRRSQLSRWKKLKLWFLTLFYHTSISLEYTIDVLVEPLFWFIDHFTKYLGPMFVVVVAILISIVVTVAHLLGLPFWWERNQKFTVLLILVGYWLLLNVTYNFYQATWTSPGIPDDQKLLSTSTVTVCKKCINPKPPRTHHCSICHRCFLSMDHHCQVLLFILGHTILKGHILSLFATKTTTFWLMIDKAPYEWKLIEILGFINQFPFSPDWIPVTLITAWVNNCIGHFNRRYFFLSMVYLVAGSIFIMIFGVEIAYYQLIVEDNLYEVKDPTIRSKLPPAEEPDDPGNEPCEVWLGVILKCSTVKLLVYSTALLCVGVSVALGGLTIWHGRLISRGETSIEYHINKSERRKTKEFINPYDLGPLRNWELFLGLDQPRICSASKCDIRNKGYGLKMYKLLLAHFIVVYSKFVWHSKISKD